ncbi:MAG: glycosyltransferase family 2 protein [Patescibacteria group bacterium]|nr:glycosyltransferase family 2 protein [Patescibacteria group bacterium]
MKISCVIPAYNEEKTIFGIVEVVKGIGLFDEIIVISDGSTDMTPYILKRIGGIDFIDLEQNVGKGGAVWQGLQKATGEVIVMLDADLIGVSREHLEKIITPLKNEGVHVCVGVIQHEKRAWMSFIQKAGSNLSGQQAFFKYLIEDANIKDSRFGLEIALKNHFKKKKARVKKVFLPGVSHLMKEQKMGLEQGLKHRGKMYREVGKEIGSHLKNKIKDNF